MSGEAKCGGLIRGVRRYGWTTVGVIATLFISFIFNGILYLVSIAVFDDFSLAVTLLLITLA